MLRSMIKPPRAKKARKMSAKSNKPRKKTMQLSSGGGVKIRGAGAVTQGNLARGPMG